MLFTSPSSSLLLLLVLVASSASSTVSARPLPSSAYKITPFSSVQLVGRQDGLIDLLGLEGGSTDAAAGEEEESGTTSVAVLKGGSTTTTVGKETSAAAAVQVATRESTTTTTPTTKASAPTTLTTAKQVQLTSQVVVGTQTAATSNAVVVVATPSSAASLLSSAAISPSSPATSTPTSTALISPLVEDPLLPSPAVASLSISFTRSSLLPSASSTPLPPTTANLSTTPSPSPFSPQSSLFPLLLTGIILGSLLTLGLLFLVLKRVVIPSSRKSKRWGGKAEGEEVLPWNELGSEGRMVESGLGGGRIGETSRYPVSYGQQQQAPRGIASSETGFGIGSYQYQSSAGFDRDPRVLPNYGAGGEVVGWPGDVLAIEGAMENRTRGVGVGMPPPVYEEGRVAIGGRGRSEKRSGGAGGR